MHRKVTASFVGEAKTNWQNAKEAMDEAVEAMGVQESRLVTAVNEDLSDEAVAAHARAFVQSRDVYRKAEWWHGKERQLWKRAERWYEEFI